jgi:hypothetical protein
MLSAIKATQKIATSKSWKGYFKGFWGDFAKVKTDTQLIEYVRNNAGACVPDLFLFPRGLLTHAPDLGCTIFPARQQ